MILATNIKYDVNTEDIEDNIDFIREQIGKNLSTKEIAEYLQKHPDEIYNIFQLPDTIEIPKKIANDDDDNAISDYISDTTGWLHNGYQIAKIKSFKSIKKATETCLAAQRVLMDNGIDADETSTVLEALGSVLFDEDWTSIIEWDKEKIPYKESIWE